GDEERAVGPDCQAGWTMLGLAGRLRRPGESVSKYLALPRCAIARQRPEHHVVAALGVGRPIPRSMERDEDAVTVVSRELLLLVQRHRVRRPVGGKRCDRGDL